MDVVPLGDVSTNRTLDLNVQVPPVAGLPVAVDQPVLDVAEHQEVAHVAEYTNAFGFTSIRRR